MNERNNKIEEFFDNDEDDIREDDYIKNSYRHKIIRRSKAKPKKRNFSENEGNNIKEKEKKKSQKNEKNNINKLSKMELFILSLLKRIRFLCENKMVYQIIFIYLIFFTIFLIIIIFMKNKIVSKAFNYFEEKTYYSYVEGDIIITENILKAQIDTKNSNNMISAIDEHLLFMEIYTQELILHNIMKKNVFNKLDNDELERYENELGVNFKATSSLKDLVNEDVEDNDNKNIKNLIPYYYHFSPIIYQNLGCFGMEMINFYFIGNDKNCNKANINNLYFKYPIENNNIGIDFLPLNNKIYDYIIDPFDNCNNGYNIEKNLLEIIKDNNWYYNLIKKDKSIEIYFRFFKIMKMSQETKRKDYYIIYNKFNLVNKEGKIINFLFSIRLSEINTIYPFIISDEYNDTLNYDYLSIFNFDKEIKHINISNLKKIKNSVYEYDYNFDDSKNIILKSPKFIENINLFGLQKKEDSSSVRILKNMDEKLSLDSPIMLKYDEINNILQIYDVNYFYNEDILYYKLVYFFNEFYLYKQKYPNYLLNESDNISNETLIEGDHPCSISNIDDYYNDVIQNFNYDCIYDYCFFHNCDALNDLYISRINLYLPNCYCLPLYCKDEKTQKNSNFEKKLKEKLYIEDNEEFDYSFTSKYEHFIEENHRVYPKFTSVFNRYVLNFKCQILFNKRNKEDNKLFIANIKYLNFLENNIIVFIFLFNNSQIEKIIEGIKNLFMNILSKIVIGYLIVFLIISILLFAYIYSTCNKLIKKMKKFKNIRKSIITNANNIYNNKNKISNIIENKDDNNEINNYEENNLDEEDKKNNNINNIDNNENDYLIINQENKEKNSKNKTVNNYIDELDELIKLINDNLNIFKIEFNLNEEVNDSINNLKKQYNEIIQVNKYKNKLLLNEKKEEIIFNNFNDSSMSSSNNSEIIKKNNNIKKDDLSVNILSELLSLSNHKFDFSKIKTNFYYKENDDNTLYNLNEIITSLNENNIQNSNDIYDITNIEKIKTALEHYSNNIHSYWKNYYDVQKAEDEI